MDRFAPTTDRRATARARARIMALTRPAARPHGPAVAAATLALPLWPSAPGLAAALMIPALVALIGHLHRPQRRGLFMDPTCWRLMSRRARQEIPTERIAYLRLAGHGPVARAVIVLRDGGSVAIPFEIAPDLFDLIRSATELGVPVRSR